MPIKKKEEKVVEIKEERRKIQRDFDGLITQLSNQNPTERRWAARDLAEYKEASGYLIEQLKKEKDIAVREIIISSLLAIGDEIAISGLINYLKSDDAHLRNSAIEALKQIPEQVAPYIEKLLQDKESDIRIFTINILESLRHPKVIKWLIDVIEKDENINVCSTALDLLAEVGTEEALPAIKKVKERFKNEPYIQFVSDIALRRVGEQ
ncbi:MAG: HEAT repeat domain-containing protein [Thermodesulfovibrio sp.]|jgi:HEAT repeat protein|uniref:HEAT repeat domain-containing protein n=1 Tax=unclassified Thermodesulfovibrio TaxID=2645936 RepID=UPI000839D9B2|nr:MULTISPECIES: HEAT repeat domain-containing protein [unclassified Thermodesulfovibrio]MDI1472377.1 HEAT repeat domain-containing protein [Thermodesulfovibrio sp. 1176]MDI6714242.1 HEAT repeat domain-containing protein [Thermodesulfovibrio sp.]ODA43944.1 HEAT repeat protein [Thermodesulfovibrio sp. N1]